MLADPTLSRFREGSVRLPTILQNAIFAGIKYQKPSLDSPSITGQIRQANARRQLPATLVRGINMADESGWQSREAQPQDVEAQAFAQKFNISPDLATRLIDLYRKQRAAYDNKRPKKNRR
jgi:hypothetical protein